MTQSLRRSPRSSAPSTPASPRLYRSSALLFLLKPVNIILVTSLLSLLAWLLPSFGVLDKGFSVPINPGLSALLLCGLWLLICLVTARAGMLLGRALAPSSAPLDRGASLDAFFPYLFISAFTWVGMSFALLVIVQKLGLSGILEAVQAGQGNAFKNSLYEDYSIGVLSLRYSAILSGALALYHLCFRRYTLLNIVNLLFSLALAFTSSRLSLVCTVVLFLCLLGRRGAPFRINVWFVGLGGVALFNLLSLLNYVRNVNYYREIGIENFYAASLSQLISYLGAPFQGFLTAGQYGDRLQGYTVYEVFGITTIRPEFNTNSTFLELVQKFGLFYALLGMAVTCLIGGVLMGIAERNRGNLLFLWYGVILYCFFEIWRIYLFGQGIIVSLLLITGFCTFASLVISRYAARARRPVSA